MERLKSNNQKILELGLISLSNVHSDSDQSLLAEISKTENIKNIINALNLEFPSIIVQAMQAILNLIFIESNTNIETKFSSALIAHEFI